MEREPRLAKTWEVAMRGADGEWDTTTLHSYEHPVDPTEDYPQAVAARITPSKRKPPSRDHQRIVAFGDMQVGFRKVLDYETGEETLVTTHDERAMAIARALCREIQPDVIVNLSDSVDLPTLGKFGVDSDQFHRTLSMSFQRVHDYYAELRADNPHARIVEVASNHNERLNKFVLNRVPDLYGLQRASSDSRYPVLTYPYLTNLEHVGVEWIGGYPAGEFVYGEEYDAPPIVFRHGTESSQNGTTASKVMKNFPETHNVHGHDHKDSEAWHTLRNGRALGSFVVGALCKTTGEVPSYGNAVNESGQPVYRQEKWGQSILAIKDYQNGDYEFQRIRINPDTGAYYEGRQYDGA